MKLIAHFGNWQNGNSFWPDGLELKVDSETGEPKVHTSKSGVRYYLGAPDARSLNAALLGFAVTMGIPVPIARELFEKLGGIPISTKNIARIECIEEGSAP